MLVGRVAAIDKSIGCFQTTNDFYRMREVYAEEEVAMQSQGRKDTKSMLAVGGTPASSI